MKGKDLLSVSDLSSEDVNLLMSDTMVMKASGWLSSLSGKSLALLFEKPSLRTRVSFEVAIRQLGGQAIYLSPDEVGLGKRESVADVANVLDRYVDAIVARTFSHSTLEVIASHADIPVINALSDREHPCQALADLFTIYERKGELQGLTLAYIGDGNNVAQSLLLAATLTGLNFRIASPKDYTIDKKILSIAQDYVIDSGATIFVTEKPTQAVINADIVYTDVWTSMGQEAESKKRRQIFADYQINSKLIALAKEDAILMHPLPAHHGEEVAEGVLDSPASVVFDQAENRMHLTKALLVSIMGGLEVPLPGY
ncbi:MAG: ornithine carbamoyltransferase [Dehalococcoidia bacterium]|nr:MAG: ornithine carbamoyltransferase [Dehalococcoidia bacterium]